MGATIRDGRGHITCSTCGAELVLDGDQVAHVDVWSGAIVDEGWTLHYDGQPVVTCRDCWDDTPTEQGERPRWHTTGSERTS